MSISEQSTGICHPLNPICTLLQAVSAYLYRKNFMSQALREPLLPDSVDIRFVDAAVRDKQVTATPTVAYMVGDMTIALTTHGGANSLSPLTTIGGSIVFSVSTPSKPLTQELSFEIGSFCMAMRPLLIQNNCYIKDCVIGKTAMDDSSTFFRSDVVAHLTLNYQQWNVTDIDGILREVRISTNLST